jgi:hypothetical protein
MSNQEYTAGQVLCALIVLALCLLLAIPWCIVAVCVIIYAAIRDMVTKTNQNL